MHYIYEKIIKIYFCLLIDNANNCCITFEQALD